MTEKLGKKDAQSKEKQFRESPWYILNLLRKIDQFGVPIPAFNIQGEDEVKSAFGGIMTATVMIFIVGYFFNKLNTITYNKNPIMNQSTI